VNRGGDAQLDGTTNRLRNPHGVGHRRDTVFGAAADISPCCETSDAEKQYWKFRAPAAARLLDVARRRHPDPAPVELIGIERRDDIERIGKRRNEIGSRHRTDLQRRLHQAPRVRGTISILRSVGIGFAVS